MLFTARQHLFGFYLTFQDKIDVNLLGKTENENVPEIFRISLKLNDKHIIHIE